MLSVDAARRQNGQMIQPEPWTARKATVLVVDDDEDVREMLCRLLGSDGYHAVEAATGAEVMSTIARSGPDLVLLDVVLDHEDGLDLLTSIRRASEAPVILLTGRDQESDRVLGLRLGADDYVVKPFSGPELLARIGSVLRRAQPRSETPSRVLQFGRLVIDLDAREVRVAETLVETTAKEFDLLAFLAGSPRQVFTRDQLLDQVWRSSASWQDAGTVTEHIRRIRRKLQSEGEDRWIRTVRGVGYRFEP
jgi:two-component system, OmpR family, phosphate regulon response regulator PhoB